MATEEPNHLDPDALAGIRREVSPRPAEQPGWQRDEAIGAVHLWGETYDLRLRSRSQLLPFRPGRDRELIPVRDARRTCLTGQAYVNDVRFSPLEVWQQRRRHDLPDALRRPADLPLGDVQAFYYEQERTLVLWDASLHAPYQQAEPAIDPNLRALWHGTETLLARQFPRADRLVAPSFEPGYDRAEYRAFLDSLGYTPITGYAVSKPLR